MTKAQKFNKRMDDLFHSTPGAWYGSMPMIEDNGNVRLAGHIALDPKRAAHGVEFVRSKFQLAPDLQIGEPEASGARAIIVTFWLGALDEAAARIARARPSKPSQKNKMNRNSDLTKLAESFISTDTGAIREDVKRLGSVEAAAEYAADMSIGQPDWEALSSAEGRQALSAAIRNLVG